MPSPCCLWSPVGKATNPCSRAQDCAQGARIPLCPALFSHSRFWKQLLPAIAERGVWESSAAGQTELGGCRHWDLVWEAAEGPGEFVSAGCCCGLSPATLGCSLSCREQVIFQQLPNDPVSVLRGLLSSSFAARGAARCWVQCGKAANRFQSAWEPDPSCRQEKSRTKMA